MVITAKPIVLKPLSSWEKAQKTRAKLPMPLRILTSLKTTAVLGAVLGTLVAPAATGRLALGALKGAGKFAIRRPLTALITIPTAAVVIAKSKRVKEIGKRALDPRETIKRGEKIAELIDEPSRASDILGLKDKGIKDKVVTGLKAAGLIGAAAAVAVGGAAALKKGKSMLEARAQKKALEVKTLEPGLRQMGFTDPQPVGLGGVPVKQAIPGLPGAPGAPISQPAVSNIIQIQLA